ncbi:MAG: hypothetical protein AAF587_05835 [Bacteroidota bacterium]
MALYDMNDFDLSVFFRPALNHMMVRVCLFLSLCFGMKSQISAQNHLAIHIPSPEEEAEYVWRTIQDIRFFEQYKYPVNLPEHPLIDTLIRRCKQNRLSDASFPELVQLIKSDIYQKEDYQAAARKIDQQLPLINRMIHHLKKMRFRWEFHSFDQYRVRLTLYGSGGSFNPDDGSLILLTTPQGSFRQYPNPANTIIHEIIHIGIERAIVQKYELAHPVKERIVDGIMLILFSDLLPDHRIQQIGSSKINDYLNKKREVKRLDKVIEQFLEETR